MDNLPSLACLIIGGFLAALQVFTGIVGLSMTAELRPGARGAWNQLKLMAAGFGLAVPFLAAGAWLSANPWTALGKTLLVAAALGTCAGFLILKLAEEEKEVKRAELELLPGMVNLVLIVGAALMFYVRGMRGG